MFKDEELYSRLIAVTDRSLCTRPFPEQIARVCARHPRALILREKDMPEREYERLAAEVMKICAEYDVPCILHSYAEAARRLGCGAIHMPLTKLEQYHKVFAVGSGEHRRENEFFTVRGVSVHSAAEAIRAEELGATYLTAGHIFPTGCKAGIPPRGLSFLQDVAVSVSIPVYGIGGIGIDAGQIQKLLDCGAAGGCAMSAMMSI